VVDLAPSMKPEPVVLIKGKVFNAKTNQPIEAKILYEDLNAGKNAGIARSEQGVGSYKIVLPRGTHYGFYAEAKGFLSLNESLDIPDTKSEYLEIEKNLYLVPIELGQSMRINNVFFQQSTAILFNTSYAELDRLVQIMKDNPRIVIELAGHTDNIGDANKNLDLSLKRVEVVKKYLVEKGISSDRVTLKAYGGSKPIVTSGSPEERQKNRRVEFTIIKN
jgi:OmpA-OmpF porin, OOP family